MAGECLACQAKGLDPHPDPLQMSPLPPDAWHTVHIDFGGPFPTGEYLLVVIDVYSRFPDVAIVHSTSANTTVNKLARIFAIHGIPRKLRNENGPPFTSHEFKTFMEELRTNRTNRTNSEAESFIKPLNKTILAAQAEGQDWCKELFVFLLNYRATPHVTTGVPHPCYCLCVIRTKLPQIISTKKTKKATVIRKRDEEARAKNEVLFRQDEESQAIRNPSWRYSSVDAKETNNTLQQV